MSTRHLARAGLGIGQLLDLQHVGTAELLEHDRLHAGTSHSDDGAETPLCLTFEWESRKSRRCRFAPCSNV